MSAEPIFLDLSGSPLDELWQLWQANHSSAVRRALIRRYAPLADRVCGLVTEQGGASRFVTQPSTVAMRRWANDGLSAAIDEFDLSNGHVFEMFAIPRIKQAILDGLAIATSTEPSLRAPQVSPLHRALTLDDRDRCEQVTTITDSGDEIAEENGSLASADRREVGGQLRERFLALLAPLPERQRTILRHYYVEGLTPSEIARLLEVDVGIVMTAHAIALETIRRTVTGEVEKG